MTDETTPRATFRSAFYQVLNTALGTDISVVKYRPPEGLPLRSIGLGIVSEVHASPGIGRRASPTQSGMIERLRIQIDIFEADREQAEVYADKVDQAILDALVIPFFTTHGIMNIRKVGGTDSGPTEQLAREAHVILDYQGSMIATKTE